MTSIETGSNIQMDFHLSHDIGNYSANKNQVKQLQAKLDKVQDLVRLVNAGLPEGHYLSTKPCYEPEDDYRNGLYDYDEKKFSRVYRPDSEGIYLQLGSFAFEAKARGRYYSFIGDRFLETETSLIIINSEAEIGMSVTNPVEIINPCEQPDLTRTSTKGWSRHDGDYPSFGDLLHYMTHVKEGETRIF